MRIVRPDDDLCGPASSREVPRQRLECLDHVPVAQIPRRHILKKHRAVVAFGVFYQSRILFGKEQLVFRDPGAAQGLCHGLFHRALMHVDQLSDDLITARSVGVGGRNKAVDLRVRAEMVKAGVAHSCPPRGLGIDPFQIVQHRLHRGVQAIEVEAVKAALRYC